MRRLWLMCTVVVTCSVCAEDVFRERFEGPRTQPPVRHSWGDKPSVVAANSTEPNIGLGGSAAAHLKVVYPAKVKRNLSYWCYDLAQRIPLVPQLKTISFCVKTNVPVSIKIPIWPFGFIYHGPKVAASPKWQKVVLDNAYERLKNWCARGKKSADRGWVNGVIIAVWNKASTEADVIIDDIAFEGPTGATEAVRREVFARRIRSVRVAAISLIWDEGYRTLDRTLEALDEAGTLGADIACLPEQCVYQPGEPIPGPTSEAICRKAAQYRMYVVATLRERDEGKTYVTSFLCDREGKITGKYRKSHKMPYEEGFDLGNDLPVFATDFGVIGMKIGTDHYFPEIDMVLRRRGASLIVWSTSPFPNRDEHLITLPIRGRAVQNRVYYAVARYAGKEGYGGYARRFAWTATWPLGRAQVFAPDGHTIADSGHAGGVALATIPAGRLRGTPRDWGYPTTGMFKLITQPQLPSPFARAASTKRTIRAAVIEQEPNIDKLIEKLDACGQLGCDIVCLWEYVWYRSDEQVEKFRERNRGYLRRIADAAKRNKMYVVIAGELERGFNESILFDREGKEIGRYTKIRQTTSKTSKYYRAGDRVGIFDLDFGRICTKICADVGAHEIDRVAALYQVDLMLLSTQDAGPYSEAIRLRDAHRCVDNGYYLLRAAGGGNERDHRTYIMDPWGMVLAASQFRVNNPPIVTQINLDNRPRYYEWSEAVRRAGPYPDPVKRGIPLEARLKMYGRFHRPTPRGDLRAVILGQRRPELYARHGDEK